jgi:hypothetical protein
VLQRANFIEVVSDGISDQKGTKVDLYVKINGKPSGINLSLKSGATKQLGQIAGASLDKQREFWGYFGVYDDFNHYEFIDKDVEKWLHFVYYLSTVSINQLILCSSSYCEILTNAIKHFAVLGDESIQLVHLSGGSFKVLSFKTLLDKLRPLRLECVYNGNAVTPSVYIQDHETGERLISMRVKRENRDGTFYYRNYVEKQSLLIKLLEVNDYEQADPFRSCRG